MKLLLADLKSVSFHDTKLISVEERLEYICMKLDSICIGAPLKEAEGQVWTLHDCSFECFGVKQNEKEEWDDTRSAKPSSNANLPISEILDEKIKGNCFELSGFTYDRNWAVWKIEADEYELKWKSKEVFRKTD